MKKRTLKSLSVVCVLALIISLCPCFSVSAATSLGDLTTEKLAVSETAGNQIPSSIVADLTLPTDGITWSSSNEAVISSTGKVTRPLAKDEDVTLTATASEGGATKDFSFTVKAQTTKVFAQESFYYTGLENSEKNTNIFNSMAGWSNARATTASQIKTDTDGNKYAELGLNPTSGADIKWEKTVAGDKVRLDFDLMVNTADATKGFANLNAMLQGIDSNGAPVSVEVRLALIQSDRWICWGGSGTGKWVLLTSGKMNPTYIDIDLANKDIIASVPGITGTSYYDGEICTMDMIPENSADAAILNDDGVTFTSVSWVRMFNSGASRNFYVDNFMLSAQTDVDTLIADLTAGKQVETIKNHLDSVLPKNSASLPGETVIPLNTYGGLVEWKNYVWENGALTEKACTDSVTLSQNDTTFNAGRLVATITPTGEGDRTPKTYTYPYAVVPKNTGVRHSNDADVRFNFDGDYVAPQTMNNNQANVAVSVWGAEGTALPANVTYTAEFDSDTELNNKSVKFVNNSGSSKTFSLTDGTATMVDKRMQFGADFKADDSFTLWIQDQTGSCIEIPFDNDGTFSITERDTDLIKDKDGNYPETTTVYNMADYGVAFDRWNRIEIDLSTVGAVYDVYLNGKKVNDAPLNFNTIKKESTYYLAYTLRYVHFDTPNGRTIQLDNVAVAETGNRTPAATVEGAYRRIVRNFWTDKTLYAGETLYTDLRGEGALPGIPHEADGRFDYTPSISWKLDGVALESNAMPSTADIGTHTLTATITSFDGSVTKDYTTQVTVSPVSIKVLAAGLPEVKMASNVSGKLVVAKYTGADFKELESVKVYEYTNGVLKNGESDEFNFEADSITENTKLFFFDSSLKPLAINAIK